MFSNDSWQCCVVLSFPATSTRVCCYGKRGGRCFSSGTTASAHLTIQAIVWDGSLTLPPDYCTQWSLSEHRTASVAAIPVLTFPSPACLPYSF